MKKEGLKLCSQLKLQYQAKRDLKASKKDLGSFYAQYGIEMPIPPSQRHKQQKHFKEKPYKKYKKFKSHNKTTDQKQKSHKKHKREVRCFKCGQKGHIAPNCRKQKLNVLSGTEEECYSEYNTSSSKTGKSQTKSTTSEKKIEKIENCLCQIITLTADQELFKEMIYQIDDKETKAKYLRKILEHQNTKPKSKNNLANSYKMKYIIQYYKNQEPTSIQDLQIEIKQIKTQIDELKLYTQNMDVRIANLEKQKDTLTNQTSKELETFVNNMTVVQKLKWYTKKTLKSTLIFSQLL